MTTYSLSFMFQTVVNVTGYFNFIQEGYRQIVSSPLDGDNP